MHILFLSHYFPPEVNAPAVRTYENCKFWVKNGHNVTIVTGVPNMPDGIIYKGYRNKLIQHEKKDGIRVIRVWTYVAPNKGFFRRILNYISYMLSSLFFATALVKKADCIIATSPQFFCAIAGSILSRLRHLPFVLEIRDLWPDSIIAVDALKNRHIINILRRIELSLYRRATRIVVVTESFRKIIGGKGIAKEKIFTIKNGVDLPFFSKHKESQLAKELNLKNKFIVSYIGTIGMAHALEHVLRVAKRLESNSDIAFLIIGSGARRDELFRLREKLMISNLTFIDRQPKERILSYYGVSDACLVPLKNDPLFKTVLPSKIFEIMAMAKPVILGVDGEARELVESAKAGIFYEPENEDQLQSAILTLFSDTRQCKLMGEHGRKFVEKHHDRSNLAAHYLHVLSGVQ
jgi:glycosyltransferase involved in cell wall biosynthesis